MNIFSSHVKYIFKLTLAVICDNVKIFNKSHYHKKYENHLHLNPL